MEIFSTKINPFVRFAAYRNGDPCLYKKTSYAQDCRLFYIKKGQLVLTVNDKPIQLEANDVLIIPPMFPYKMETEKNSSFYLVNFDYLTDAARPELAIPLLFSAEKTSACNIRFADLHQLNEPFKTNVPGLEPFFLNMAKLYAQKPLYFRNELNAYFSLALSGIFKHIINTKPDNMISEIISYVNLHYAEPLTNSSIGRLFHYHPNYIGRLFVKHTGQSLHKYLVGCRIDAAINMLNSGNYSITEIAAKTGWNNISHFSMYFKKFTGYPPSAFIIK